MSVERGEGRLISIYTTALEVLWSEAGFLGTNDGLGREDVNEQAVELLCELLRKTGYAEVADWHDKIRRRLYP